MKAALRVIWVLEIICLCAYRGKQNRRNGSEAATLDVYCTDRTGTNENPFQQAVHNVSDSHSDHRPQQQWVSAFL